VAERGGILGVGQRGGKGPIGMDGYRHRCVATRVRTLLGRGRTDFNERQSCRAVFENLRIFVHEGENGIQG
jgi:hypothetical protein